MNRSSRPVALVLVPIAALAALLACVLATAPARAETAQTTPTAYPAHNDSGTITTGSTFQLWLPVNPARVGCFIQNNNASHIIYVFLNDGVATQTKGNSYQVQPLGGFFSCAGAGVTMINEIDITGDGTGDVFTASHQ